MKGKVSNLITSLKSTREARGMTQQELAERIGVRRETIIVTILLLKWL